MNGDEIRDTWFCPPPALVAGYDAGLVDDLVRRIAAELDVGRPAGPLITNTRLRERTWKKRYDIDAVNWFRGQFFLPPGHPELAAIGTDPWYDLPVAQLAPGGVSGAARLHHLDKPSQVASQAYFASQCENAWRDFGQLPGTHLWCVPVGRPLRDELRTAEQQTLASVRISGGKTTVSAGGRSFTYKRPQLVDERGIHVLEVAGANSGRRAVAFITLSDQRALRFLVRGTERANAIMTAVDQWRNRVARYRITSSSLEPKTPSDLPGAVQIIVHPGWKLTNELALALLMSARWLDTYFRRPSRDGGDGDGGDGWTGDGGGHGGDGDGGGHGG